MKPEDQPPTAGDPAEIVELRSLADSLKISVAGVIRAGVVKPKIGPTALILAGAEMELAAAGVAATVSHLRAIADELEAEAGIGQPHLPH